MEYILRPTVLEAGVSAGQGCGQDSCWDRVYKVGLREQLEVRNRAEPTVSILLLVRKLQEEGLLLSA